MSRDTVSSMTGFGVAEAHGEQCRMFVQIRTVNHRYLDWKPKIPSRFYSLEQKIKTKVREKLHRGSVELLVRYEETKTQNTPWNEEVVVSLADGLKGLTQKLHISEGRYNEKVFDWVLHFRDQFLQDKFSQCSDDEEKTLLKAVDEALTQVEEKRKVEGTHLSGHCRQLIESLRERAQTVAERSPEIAQLWFEKLKERLGAWESQASFPENRLEQEMMLMAEKADVSEELVRLQSHFKVFEDLLTQKGPKGKKLDFFIQEIHREINTIGSKVSDTTVSVEVMELKASLEQLREQVQNIE